MATLTENGGRMRRRQPSSGPITRPRRVRVYAANMAALRQPADYMVRATKSRGDGSSGPAGRLVRRQMRQRYRSVGLDRANHEVGTDVLHHRQLQQALGEELLVSR